MSLAGFKKQLNKANQVKITIFSNQQSINEKCSKHKIALTPTKKPLKRENEWPCPCTTLHSSDVVLIGWVYLFVCVCVWNSVSSAEKNTSETCHEWHVIVIWFDFLEGRGWVVARGRGGGGGGEIWPRYEAWKSNSPRFKFAMLLINLTKREADVQGNWQWLGPPRGVWCYVLCAKFTCLLCAM